MILERVLASLLLATMVSSQRIHRMKVGETLEMNNDEYPNVSTNKKIIWMFGTDRGGAINLECNDIRIKSSHCNDARIIVSAGDSPETICNTREKYSVSSLFESLYVELDTKSGEAAINCKVTALSSPAPVEIHREEFFVKIDEINSQIEFPSLSRVTHYEYTIIGETDSKLMARCSFSHVNSMAMNKCDGASVSISSATREIEACESDKVILHSEDNTVKIVLKTGLLVGSGFLYCRVRCIANGDYSNYKTIPSEEVDSSEHGSIRKKGQKSTSCNCGWANKDVNRIIYGHDTGKHEYPWSVSLQYTSGFHFCGGSIISEFHILSAAHCIHTEPDQIQVVMGTNNNSDVSYAIRVKEIILHDYDKNTNQNDIAILVLEKIIDFNQFIGPVCLPSQHPRIDHQYVTAMGWGALAEDEYATKDRTIQKETKLRAIDIFSCTADWNFRWKLKTAKVMCTWSNHTDICMGDSGGPVVWLDPETNRYTLVGMPALCDGCGLTKPSVHTAVSHFYDWILASIAGSSQPDGKTCTKID